MGPVTSVEDHASGCRARRGRMPAATLTANRSRASSPDETRGMVDVLPPPTPSSHAQLTRPDHEAGSRGRITRPDHEARAVSQHGDVARGADPAPEGCAEGEAGALRGGRRLDADDAGEEAAGHQSVSGSAVAHTAAVACRAASWPTIAAMARQSATT